MFDRSRRFSMVNVAGLIMYFGLFGSVFLSIVPPSRDALHDPEPDALQGGGTIPHVIASVAPRSSPWQAKIDRAQGSDRASAALILTLGVAWLAYTRFYFWLHPRGLTGAPSLFMHLTGRPDPLCGLTRTFAWMWRGDLIHAVAVYPLGPLVFAATFPLLGYAAAVLVSGRALRFGVSRGMRHALSVVVVTAVAPNWAAKLIWLGI
jgi:hypothetical protein